MARLSIPDEPTSLTFTVTTSTTTFPFGFAIFGKEDLSVSLNGVALAGAAYTLTGSILDGGGYQGGSIVLNNAVSSGMVTVARQITPQRAEDFGAVTAVPVRAVDMALKRQMAISQDLDRRIRDTQAGEVDPDALQAVVEEALDGQLGGLLKVDASNLTDPADRSALRAALKVVQAEAAKASSMLGEFRIEKTPEEYRATGVTDVQAIQAAINAMSGLTGGGRVRLDGQYSVTESIVLKSNVSLTGGRLKAAAGFSGAMVKIDPGSENTSVVGVYFDGDLIGIDDATFGGTGIGLGPGLTQAKAVTVTGCTFKMPVFPTLAPGADDPRFARLGGESDADYAIRLNGPGGLYKSFHCTLFNNVLATVTGNICLQCGGDSFGHYAGLVTFTGNLVMFSADGGLALNLTPAGVASGNHFFRCGLGIGIGSNVWIVNPSPNPFSGLHIAGNFFYGCGIGIEAGWFGVYLDAPTNAQPTEGPRYLSVIANHFTRCKDRAVGFFGREDTIDMNITVADNVVRESGSALFDGTTGTGDGIRIDNCKGASVRGNHVVRGLGTAFKFQSTRQLVFSENHSDGNPVGVDWGSGGSVLRGKFWSRNDTVEEQGTITPFVGDFHFLGVTSGSATTNVTHNIGVGYARVIAIKTIVNNAGLVWEEAVSSLDGDKFVVQTASHAAGRPISCTVTLGNYNVPGL